MEVKRVLVLGKKKDYLEFIEKNKDKGFRFDHLSTEKTKFKLHNLYGDSTDVLFYAEYGLRDYFVSLVNDSYTKDEKVAFNSIGLKPSVLIKEYILRKKLRDLYEKEFNKLDNHFITNINPNEQHTDAIGQVATLYILNKKMKIKIDPTLLHQEIETEYLLSEFTDIKKFLRKKYDISFPTYRTIIETGEVYNQTFTKLKKKTKIKDYIKKATS